MLLYLSPKDLAKISLVKKRFKKLSNSDIIWGRFLKKDKRNDKRNKDENNAHRSDNKKLYINEVEFRKPGYIHYDIKGVDYLIRKVFKQRTDLTDIQKAHLGSALVRRLICTEQLTIKKALYNSLPQQVIGLNEYQLRGIRAGLTREQVNHKWFDYWHAEAAKKGISYEQYQGLTENQVEYGILKGLKREQVIGLGKYQLQGMNAGLTREQVENDWFDYWHAEAAEKGISYEQYQGLTKNQVEYGILKGLKREQVIGLGKYQLQGMNAGLTREQVENDWFDYWHAEAAEKGISYEQYQGLTKNQVEYGILKGLKRKQVIGLGKYQLQGMNAGLTREQVEHNWFGFWHARLAEAKIPYEDYKELSGDKARAIFRRLEGNKFFRINHFASVMVMHIKAKYSDSRDSKIAFNTGMVLKEAGNHKRALSCFWQSIEFNPDYFEPAWNLTDIFIQQKNDEELTRLLNFLGRKGSRALSKLRDVIAKKWPEFSKKHHDEELKNVLDHTHSMPVKMFGFLICSF
ncbi:MAG: hypothetical protein PVG30_03210 [Gammaproteobacteria bacterium]|jgi:hypothetical protein